MMRSIPVSSKMRGTAAPETASSTRPPSAWARLCAPTRAAIPAESQNRVRVMSTTNVRCSPASDPPASSPAAVSSAARSPAALVMSISSGAATTGTPWTSPTGKLTSRICITSHDPDR
jgi:hypothetical protein